ncbi:uncharacterized protein LOC132608382 [Lycium barbarum]|uniref:uncharacterized protein LOC132608382 n=1 Tax=Lycium barbarum TaxID=112863 RepID=UPI00293E206B|nr:uncharacterized protein LOC132608382 [Lycium barbarum]
MAQVVTCRVKFTPMQLEFVATFVYAYNVKEDRKMLWDHISHLSVNRKEPWIILGDFNVVLHRDDRMGGNPVTLAEVTDFQNCIDNCGLEEMANSGNKYTWSDKQAARIFSKIDRVLVNGEWVDQMPTITAHANQDREALRRVQRQLQQTALNDAIQREENELNVKFRRSVFLAESLLLQRSKATWIRQGDDNTKYFFSMIKKRKLIQTITQIQDEHGQRQHEQAQVVEVLVRYYQQLLGDSGGPRKPADNRIFAHGPTVSAEQQWGLLQPLTCTRLRQRCSVSRTTKAQARMDMEGDFIEQRGI